MPTFRKLCLIPPDDCPDLEAICQQHSIEYDFLGSDPRGMSVLMTLQDYCLYRGYLHTKS